MVAIESKKGIFGFGLSKERNLFITERFVSELVNMYGKI